MRITDGSLPQTALIWSGLNISGADSQGRGDIHVEKILVKKGLIWEICRKISERTEKSGNLLLPAVPCVWDTEGTTDIDDESEEKYQGTKKSSKQTHVVLS